jgi:hypothetical protein
VDSICFWLMLLQPASWCSLNFSVPGGGRSYEIDYNARVLNFSSVLNFGETQAPARAQHDGLAQKGLRTSTAEVSSRSSFMANLAADRFLSRDSYKIVYSHARSQSLTRVEFWRSTRHN